MNTRGAGDRWLAGDLVDGVSFAHHQSVSVNAGVHRGELGIVLLLVALTPEPRFLVRLVSGAGDVRVSQSMLRPRD
jgi:hypothetical protein